MTSTGQQASRSEACLASRAVCWPTETKPRNPQASYYRARYYDPAAGRFVVEDPLGFYAGNVNFYGYTGNRPVNLTDPSGEIVPLIVLLPVAGGLVGGISDVLTAGPCQNKLAAFGLGFASGAFGTLAGIGVGALTGGNPWLAGAAAGQISSITDQALAGEPLDAGKVAASTAIGAIGGKALSKLFPTRGRLPDLTTSRTPSNFGPNSQRLTLQELGSDALGGTLQYLLPSPSEPKCGCN
jgi:RHS repeat-associated protein